MNTLDLALLGVRVMAMIVLAFELVDAASIGRDQYSGLSYVQVEKERKNRLYFPITYGSVMAVGFLMTFGLPGVVFFGGGVLYGYIVTNLVEYIFRRRRA